MSYRENIEQLSAHIKAHFATAPKCHDWDHTERVLHNALKIQETEGGCREIIEVAALMHDYARPEEMESKGRLCHAAAGAELTRALLPKFGFSDSTFIEHIAQCVLCHRYRNNHIPQTIEAKIIFDADKLDSIGAIGVGRAFHFAGRFAARVHNTKEDAVNSTSYSENDSAYREFLVKLHKIHEKLLTKAGRQMGEERHIYMLEFFDQLNKEVYG